MRTLRLLQAARLGLALLLFAAFASLGAGHKAHFEQLSPEMLAYLNAGFSLEDLCEQPGSDTRASGSKCEAHRIVDAVPPGTLKACMTPKADHRAVEFRVDSAEQGPVMLAVDPYTAAVLAVLALDLVSLRRIPALKRTLS